MTSDVEFFVDDDTLATGANDGSSQADAYRGWAAFIAAQGSRNLVSGDERLIATIFTSSSTADTPATFDAPSTMTTDRTSGNYMLIRPLTGHRAGTEWDTSKAIIAPTGNFGTWLEAVTLDGVQVALAKTGGSQHGPSLADNEIEFTGNYFKYTGSGGSSNAMLVWVSSVGVRVGNNIFDGFPQQAINNSRTSGTSYIYDNTFIDCLTNVEYSNSDLAVLKANLSHNSTNDYIGTYAAGTDYNSTDSSTNGYTVTGGGNSNDRVSQIITFTSATDYEPTTGDAAAYQLGVDLSGDANFPITDDISTVTRATPTTIGARDPDAIAAAFTITGPDTAIEAATVNGTGTDLNTITGVTLTVAAKSYTVDQTIDAQTTTTLDYDANVGIADITVAGPGGAKAGVPLLATVSAAGITTDIVSQTYDDGSVPASRVFTSISAPATHDVVQTMIAVADTTVDESIWSSAILTVEDDHQAYVPKTVDAVTFTWLADGSFTSTSNAVVAVDVYYFTPSTGQWVWVELTVSDGTIQPEASGAQGTYAPQTRIHSRR